MDKVVLVLCDGLGDDVARERMGYLELLVEERRATRFTSRAVLPTVSRPNYESLHTGVTPLEHGVVSNHIVRRSNHPNVFELATKAGLTTAAVSYSWFSELYHEAPYEPFVHAEYDDGDAGITHGRFYNDVRQPDSDVVARSVLLATRMAPSYLLVHPIAVDHAGHMHGRNSDEYAHAVTHLGDELAAAVPAWIALGYSVVITADHGHDQHRYHGGTTDDVRNTPLYMIGESSSGRGDTGDTVSHLQIAPTICERLGLPIPATMRAGTITW